MKIENYDKVKNIILVTMGIMTVLAIGLGTMVRESRFFGNKKAKLGNIVENTVELEDEFNQMDIELSIAELRVEYGEKASVYYKLPEKLVPEINVKDGTLNMSNKDSSKDYVGNIKDYTNADYYVTLTLPVNSTYTKINIDIDCGSMALAKLVVDDFTLDADLGNVELEGLESDSAKISADLGNIKLKSVEAKRFTIEADCGNVEIDGIDVSEISVENSMGNVKLENAKFKNGVFSLDMGDLYVSGDYDEITADCSMGAIEIFTERDESQVKLNLDVDMGGIKVNGKDWKN